MGKRSLKPVLKQHLKVISNIPQQNKHKGNFLNKDYNMSMIYYNSITAETDFHFVFFLSKLDFKAFF